MSNHQSGQIGVVVLLIMTTMLSVGIGAISRSTQDLRITRQELESSELFNAAEAGIEEALADIDAGTPPTTQTDITVDDINVSYIAQEIRNLDLLMQENQHYFIDVERGVPNSDEVRIQWAQSYNPLNCATQTPESLEVMIFSTPPDPVIINGYSRCDVGNGFIDAPAGTISVILDNNDVLIGLKTIGGDSQVTVEAVGAWNLPVQGYEVRSTATNTESDEAKVVVLDKSNEIPVSILGYTVFSGTTMIMN